MCCGEGNGTPLQYSCLANPMDGGAWQAAVHGVAKSRTRLSDFNFIFHFMYWRRKWQPTPVFLPGESQGRQSLVGCSPWGRTQSVTTEVTQQQQQPCAKWWSVLAYTDGGLRTLIEDHLQFMKVESESEVSQSCPTLSDRMDCSLPGSSIHGIYLISE